MGLMMQCIQDCQAAKNLVVLIKGGRSLPFYFFEHIAGRKMMQNAVWFCLRIKNQAQGRAILFGKGGQS